MDLSVAMATLPEYEGVKIIFTAQVADAYGCSVQNVTTNFRAHRAEFIAGVDYFFLEGAELKKFKATLAAKNSCYRPSNQTTNTYLWTQSGFEKLAKYLTTDEAKLANSALVFGYFQTAAPKSQKVLSEIETLPLREKIEVLNRYIFICQDSNLRDELIRAALNLLK